jgi:hypothetical protein
MSIYSAVGGDRSVPIPRTFVTFAAIGTLAMVLADMVHEVLGHGTACWLTGNRILSLSTVALQTADASRFVSAAGTTANCIVGGMSLLLFGRLKKLTPSTCFVWLFGIFNLLNLGYLVASAATNSSDWANVIAGLTPLWLWRCLLGLAGVVLYVAALHWAAWLMIRRVESGQIDVSDLRRLILPAYLAAGVIMTLASVFNPIGPALILGSGAGPSFGLNAGLLFIPRIVQEKARNHPSFLKPAGLNFFWIAAALASGACFVAILGPGIQFSHP